MRELLRCAIAVLGDLRVHGVADALAHPAADGRRLCAAQVCLAAGVSYLLLLRTKLTNYTQFQTDIPRAGDEPVARRRHQGAGGAATRPAPW